MKKALLVLFLLSASALFAQSGGVYSLSATPQIYQSPDHPAHASYAPMMQEQSVLAASSYTFAQGDRPASDFPQPEGISLGAAARELKKQHAELKKSKVVWINQ